MQNEYTLGERIRELRELKKISLRQLAKEVGISAGYLSQLERNQTLVGLPSEDNIKKIANILETDFTELMILADKIPTEITDSVKKSLHQGGRLDDFLHLENYVLERRVKK